ncbi:hypothetical protein, partial [Rhodopseudomonas sp. BR0G17]|uniref:hypothetical protein n=1 Tax=Rhodopseudomonas sp. BR0G17 TaxID=2269368 RepID=UPI001FEEB218
MIIDEQDVGVAIVERKGDFGRAPAGIRRIERTAAPPDAEHVLQIAIRIQREHRNAVTRRHADLVEDRGEPRRPIRKF